MNTTLSAVEWACPTCHDSGYIAYGTDDLLPCDNPTCLYWEDDDRKEPPSANPTSTD